MERSLPMTSCWGPTMRKGRGTKSEGKKQNEQSRFVGIVRLSRCLEAALVARWHLRPSKRLQRDRLHHPSCLLLLPAAQASTEREQEAEAESWRARVGDKQPHTHTHAYCHRIVTAMRCVSVGVCWLDESCDLIKHLNVELRRACQALESQDFVPHRLQSLLLTGSLLRCLLFGVQFSSWNEHITL